MTPKATLINEDVVGLEISLQTATILYQLLGRFNPNAAGPLAGLREELEDLGIESYNNLIILDQTEPTLFLHVVEVDNQEEVQ